jgi:hypothetical protein
MSEEMIEAILMFVAFSGLLMTFIMQLRLKKYVSMEKVRSINDPALLFPNSIPLKIVLNERGRFLHRFYIAGFVVFFVSVGTMVVLGIVKKEDEKQKESERLEQRMDASPEKILEEYRKTKTQKQSTEYAAEQALPGDN